MPIDLDALHQTDGKQFYNYSPAGRAKFEGFNMVYLNLFVKYIHPCVSGSAIIQVKEEILNSKLEWMIEEVLYDKLKESLQTSERVIIENIVILGRCEKDD